MYDFSMTDGVGRTYRYFKGEPLYSFGHGLSYSSFSYSCSLAASRSRAMLFASILCKLLNNGPMDGDEVLMMFHSVGRGITHIVDHPVPSKKLVDFERATLAVREVPCKIRFDVPATALTLTDADGNKVLYAGRHYLTVTNGISPGATMSIDIPKTVTMEHAPARDHAYIV